ncbi:MAG: type II toxin-antitoxin system RelB/DinJ family antitoxin [Clostridiales bacterium]|nr:type II toxin-antitoxin system RelB/DinJ family antitoxin [Clostridiales bacterium]
MTETRLGVRVDSSTKKQAESVFSALGMNMSIGINNFLTRVARSKAIPFALELGTDLLERRMQEAISAKVYNLISSGAPIALYDAIQKRPYLEYPNGTKEYDIEIKARRGCSDIETAQE